ncbi:hypothetical protein [Nonomuraea sp. 3-1Str]|uniref:hypothetical protein n=1 Tax=unclassified Nonomuraea TaxID=2593643 RepID=UPI002857B0F3|nr:hypothetical protein [Nonomuraea sp. 3-1Str]MDR8412528.1 hypothetical protein [Nonomuraea sp. 3-1Str]
MSPLKTRFASLAAVAALVVTAGCAEVNQTIDKTQACLEAPKIVADLGSQIGKLKDDPQAMDKALDDASKKLNDVADKAANTTLKEATDDLARTLGGIDVKNVNDAVDAAQKVGTDTAAYLEKVAKACS